MYQGAVVIASVCVFERIGFVIGRIALVYVQITELDVYSNHAPKIEESH